MAITNINISSPANEFVFQDTAMGATADGVKASSCLVLYIAVDNILNVAASYLKLYNLGSGSVTVGTTVPDEVILCPAGVITVRQLWTGAALGVTFGTALSAACVTVGGTTGNTPPSSNTKVSIGYV